MPFLASVALCLALLVAPGEAQGWASPNLRKVGAFSWQWAQRGVGFVLGYAVHEACHLGTIAAVGGNVSVEWEPLPHLWVSDMGKTSHRVAAWSGTVCTALGSELILLTGFHRKQDLAWGFALFHGVNSIGYSTRDGGDNKWQRRHGGSDLEWEMINSIHGTRVVAQLLWEERSKVGLGDIQVTWTGFHRVADGIESTVHTVALELDLNWGDQDRVPNRYTTLEEPPVIFPVDDARIPWDAWGLDMGYMTTH